MTSETQSATIKLDAALPHCKCGDGRSEAGFGHAGGGFGPYRRCLKCGAVFGKTSARDGNQADWRGAE